MKQILQVTDSYLLHCEVQPSYPEGHTLTIHSQWTGAKDPNGLQKKYQVTLGKENLNRLINLLIDGGKEKL
jgi:hypothetical protein